MHNDQWGAFTLSAAVFHMRYAPYLGLFLLALTLTLSFPEHAEAATAYRCESLSGADSTVPTPLVTAVANPDADNTQVLQLRQRLLVTVEQLSDCIEKSGRDPKTIVPYLDGNPIAGVYPKTIDLENNRLEFYLLRTEPSRAIWLGLLRKSNPFGAGREVRVSVGFEGEGAFQSNYKGQARLRPAETSWIVVSIAALLLLLLGILHFGRRTPMLRDGPPLQYGSETGNSTLGSGAGSVMPKAMFSLGRVQLAAWTYVIVGAYIYIGLITWDYNTLTGSSLVLLGISALTTLGAKTIDVEAKTKVQPTTGHFLKDILSDGQGMSIHRLQVVVWTVVLLIVFAISTILDLEMPQFSETILALMGISAGTYLGLKFREPNLSETETTTPETEPATPGTQ